MLDTLITSRTRIKLLLKFFLNSNASSYLRNLEVEFGESTNAIRLELNKLEKAGLLNSRTDGNKKRFQANTKHPLFNDIHNILLKHIGFDKIINNVVHKLGNVDSVYVTGDFARGINTSIIDLLFVGDDINKNFLIKLTDKVERLIKKRIRYLVFSVKDFEEYRKNIDEKDDLLLWRKE